jgi:hypothetical protein
MLFIISDQEGDARGILHVGEGERYIEVFGEEI